MSLLEFVPEEGESASLVVVNSDQPRPLQAMLEGLFVDQPVAVEEVEEVDADRDQVLLVVDGELRARSALSELQDAILLVNSDLYVTGAVGLDDLAVPDVIAALEGIPFSLQGYPESTKEKLLLIVVSRYVEQLAWRADGGTLRSSFQRLSRIGDERGTRTVYETLADTETDVHVYGIPDWQPPPEMDVTTHGGHSEDFRRGWFVVYTPEEGEGAALVAYETSPRQWKGVWTHDPDRVAAVETYVQETM
jgi:hypothetical protein